MANVNTKHLSAEELRKTNLRQKALYYANCSIGETKGSRLVEIFYAAFIDVLESQAQAGLDARWIAANQILPGYGEWAWVVCGGVVQRVAAKLEIDGDYRFWEWTDEDADAAPFNAVTHWMPLPSPPRADELEKGAPGPSAEEVRLRTTSFVAYLDGMKKGISECMDCIREFLSVL